MGSLTATLGDLALRTGTKLGLAKLVSKLLQRSCRTFGAPDAKHTVLCLSRSIFIEDVRALADSTSDVKFVLLHKSKLMKVMDAFCDQAADFKNLTEYTYHQGCCVKELSQYGAFLERVFADLFSTLSVDAGLSGNFGYKEQQEAARIFAKRGVPFIVLFKEGLVVSEKLATFSESVMDGKKFIGDKILFYSEQIRAAVLKSTAFDGATYESGVTGIPRLDSLLKASPPSPQKLVFFSFYPPDKFRCFKSDDTKLERALQAGRSFHLEVLNFAEANPDWEITIKTKVAENYVDYVADLIATFDEGKLQNVRLTNSESAQDLLLDSEVVIGFQSTTCLEALIANRKVICPDFEELFPGEEWDYFTSFPELVSYASTSKEIEKAIAPPTNSSNFEEKKQFLQQMVHGSDGKASERAIDAIIASINSVKN